MKTSSENQLPPEIEELFQIHPQLKAFAESLENYHNGVNTNPYSFQQDNEIQYREAKGQDGKKASIV